MPTFLNAAQKILQNNVRIIGAFLLGLAVGLFCGSIIFLGLPQQTAEIDTGTLNENDTAASTLPAAQPARLRIPSVGIVADFEAPLGIDEKGEVEVPTSFKTVGWYKYGPTPGELGPAVVLGHVDSINGPEIFYNLRRVELGDRVEIDREDGTTAVFEVTRIQNVAQAEFPTLEIYGDIDHAGLRLITCSGTFDRGIRRYSHNLIVYARLLEE